MICDGSYLRHEKSAQTMLIKENRILVRKKNLFVNPLQFVQQMDSELVFSLNVILFCDVGWPVSYTHLDVYKRQMLDSRRIQ